jgi:hypothetical protein
MFCTYLNCFNVKRVVGKGNGDRLDKQDGKGILKTEKKVIGEPWFPGLTLKRY